MKIEPAERYATAEETVRVSAVITDAPKRPLHRQSMTDWQPRSIHATYKRERVGAAAWRPWFLAHAGVHGKKLHKDGSDAVQDYHEPYLTGSSPEWGQWIKDHRPKDDEMRTPTGRVLTDADVEGFAAEAERGYEVQ